MMPDAPEGAALRALAEVIAADLWADLTSSAARPEAPPSNASNGPAAEPSGAQVQPALPDMQAKRLIREGAS